MVDVAGGGHVGIALETTNGTYTAPTNFVAAISETLSATRNDPKRMPILGRAVTTGKVQGRQHVEGEIVTELMPESMAFFLTWSRFGANIAQAGVGPYTYDAVDDKVVHLKTTKRSLTIVTDRAGVGFAYLGCQVTAMRLTFEDGIPQMTYTIIGLEETDEYTPGAITEPTEVPFAADEAVVSIAASARVDLDSLEINIDDSGEARFNLSGQEAADYVKFGEHLSTASFEIDFESKADYAIWAAQTVQPLLVVITKGTDQIVSFELNGALYDTFEVGLSGLGDQVRASAEMMAAYDVTDTAAVTIALTTLEDLAL